MPAGAQLQEILLNDFSPGIFTHREFAASQAAMDGATAEFINATDQPVPVADYTRDHRTIGQAVDISGRLYTYGCVGSKSGLQPLPRLISHFTEQAEVSDPDADNWGPPGARQITLATALLTPISASNDVAPFHFPDSLHILTAWYYDNNGTSHPNLHFRWRSYTMFDPNSSVDWHAQTHLLTDPPDTDPTEFHFAAGGMAMVRLTVSPAIVCVFGGEDIDRGYDGYQDGSPAPGSPNLVVNATYGTWMFPSKTNRWAVDGIDPASHADFETPHVTFPRNVIAHQDRFITLAGSPSAFRERITYGAGSNPALFLGASNEWLFYNDAYEPRYTYADDPEAFTQITDAIGGFGSWVSMNANELFLVKNIGGGVAIRGNVPARQEVNLPSIDSTYGAGALGATTPLGYIYGGRDGVFVWNGGDTTECLSPQLGRTWFWNSPSSVNDYKVGTQPKGKFAYRYPYVYVTGNWVFDIRTKSWWRLCPPSSDCDYFSYEVSSNGNVFAVNLAMEPGVNRHMFDVYDNAQSTSNYRWISQPLLRTRNRTLRFREIRVTAIGKSDISVTLVGLDGVAETIVIEAEHLSNTRLTTIALPCNLIAEDVTVMVNVEAESPDDPAATIHRISLMYEESHQIDRK